MPMIVFILLHLGRYIYLFLLKLFNPLLYGTKSSRCPKAMTLSSPPMCELTREVRASERAGNRESWWQRWPDLSLGCKFGCSQEGHWLA